MIFKPEELLNRIIGGYQLTSVIGRGAAGTVFLGVRPNDPFDKAAIKVLMPPSQLSEEERGEFHKRFLREAQVLQQLRHPHILTVHDYGEDNDTGLPYMVMPYIDGGTLSDRISKGPLSLPESAAIINQVSEALDYAHARNVVHRDIKPANVLLTSSGTAYLADFGIVKLFDTTRTTLTTAGQVMGTPEFMSPEQAQGKVVGPSADIYSMGMMIYQMTTSQLPFVGDSLVDILLQIVSTRPSSPLLLRPEMPKPVEAVIMRALDKDPGKRFTTAGELSKAFDLATRNQWAKGLVAYDPAPTEFGSHPTWEPATISPQTINTGGGRRGFIVGLTILLVCALVFALWSRGNLPNGVFGSNVSPTKTSIALAKTHAPTPKPGSSHQGGGQPPSTGSGPYYTPIPGNTQVPGSTPMPTNTPPPGSTPTSTPVPPPPTDTPIPQPTATPTPCPFLNGGNGVTFYASTNYSGQSLTIYNNPGQNNNTNNLPSWLSGHLGSFWDTNNAWHVVLFQGQNGSGNLGHYDGSTPDVGSYWQATQSVRVYLNRGC